MAGKFNIILAGKRQLILDGLKEKINADKHPNIITIETSTRSLVNQIKITFPDIVIIDQILFSEMLYTSYQDVLKKFSPWVKMILITESQTLVNLKYYLQFGFQSIVLVENDIDELVTAIRKTKQGEYYFSPEVLKVLIEDYTHPRSDTYSTIFGESKVRI
ncbi:hypothetical protein [Chondrinema litorale]|uniref:hypothetical protein n=1 Tax=Chondrinema litorale TaxID=2994555 RepID=UPI00254375EE|nr:hypothetical protein [Chondrinema litorale]UZR98729.1 hypothetical protein OQ292_32490 [Chondrinema litorale]